MMPVPAPVTMTTRRCPSGGVVCMPRLCRVDANVKVKPAACPSAHHVSRLHCQYACYVDGLRQEAGVSSGVVMPIATAQSLRKGRTGHRSSEGANGADRSSIPPAYRPAAAPCGFRGDQGLRGGLVGGRLTGHVNSRSAPRTAGGSGPAVTLGSAWGKRQRRWVDWFREHPRAAARQRLTLRTHSRRYDPDVRFSVMILTIWGYGGAPIAPYRQDHRWRGRKRRGGPDACPQCPVPGNDHGGVAVLSAETITPP